jgi:hypothetical protein
MTDQFTQPAERQAYSQPPNDRMPLGLDRPHKGRYYDPNTGTSYQRVSNLLKNIDSDRYNLERWQERMTALGLAARPDLVLGVAALGPAGDKAALNDLCRQAKDVAGSRSGANKGIALHNATERLDRGEHITNIILPPPFDTDLRAYRDLCLSAGFIKVPNMIERSVGRPDDDYMGTTDRAKYYRDANGVMSIVDVKTEKDPTYNWVHIAAQLAAYANATHIWHEGALRPLSEVGIEFSRDMGWVIHVRDGAATLYALDLVAGWKLVRAAMYLRGAHRDKNALAVAIPVSITPPPTAGIVAAAVANGPNGYAPPASATDTDAQPLLDSPQVQAVVAELSDGQATLAFRGQVTAAELAGDAQRGSAPTAPPAEIDMQDMLLREIELADDRGRLSELYEIAQGYPGLWAAVELHAMLRGQIVGCVQRALHGGGGRCACGWTPEHRP